MTPIALMMLAASPDWSRPYFEKGHGDAFIHYVVFGKVNVDAPLSKKKYDSSGPTEGIDTVKVNAAKVAEITAAFAKVASNPKAFAAAKAAPEAVVIMGTVKDPPTLDYLRDTVGVVQWALDNGGVAVLDVQTFMFFSPKQWHDEVFAQQQLTQHVVILVSDDWLHTRGMRKLGRPDLSMHGVTKAMHADVVEAFNRFIGLHARGGWIPDGQEVKLGAIPKGTIAHHAGSLDDPDFNNVHVELTPPK